MLAALQQMQRVRSLGAAHLPALLASKALLAFCTEWVYIQTSE